MASQTTPQGLRVISRERDSKRPRESSSIMPSEDRNNGHIQILIAEQRPIYGDSLRALLEKEPDFEVVGVARHAAHAIKMSQEQKPDVLLLEVAKMWGGDEIGVLEEIQKLGIPVRPLLLAAFISGQDLKRALLLGARGVVLKTSSSQALFDGIRGVKLGQYWIGAEVGASMMGALRDNTHSTSGSTWKGAFGLTSRELEIVATVAAGYSNAEIAKKFGISEQTVKHHLSRAFDRVGVFNRLELALFAVNHGLVGNK
jgi:two-component system, NarL family, nitrate/nitrite response regulator NarL